MKTSTIDIEEIKTRLSTQTWELFSCMYKLLEGVVPVEEIQISSDIEDFVRIELISKDESKLKFSFDFYNNGWFDYFMDGTEIIQMAEFKSIDLAKNYFKKCLTSEISKRIIKDNSGKVLKTDYYFVQGGQETLASKEISLKTFFITTQGSTQVFSSWLEENRKIIANNG